MRRKSSAWWGAFRRRFAAAERERLFISNWVHGDLQRRVPKMAGRFKKRKRSMCCATKKGSPASGAGKSSKTESRDQRSEISSRLAIIRNDDHRRHAN